LLERDRSADPSPLRLATPPDPRHLGQAFGPKASGTDVLTQV